MEQITEFEGRESIEEKELLDISEIVFDSFEQKIFAVSSKVSRDQWIRHLKELLTFHSGMYFKNETEIQGVALLNSKGAPTFHSFPKIINQLGILRGLSFWMIFVGPVKSPQEVKLELLAVRASSRGTGVGGKLLNYLFGFARREKYETITLDVVDTNPRAKKLYERLGFKTVKRVQTHRFTERAGFKAYDIMKRDVEPSHIVKERTVDT